MKPSTILLAVSIATNAAILALLIAGSAGQKTSASAAAASSPAGAKKSIDSATSPAAWSDLRPDDLPGLADRLRTAGFPPSVVRALLAEQVKVQFAVRRAAIHRDAPPRRFWEPPTTDPKTAAALAQLDQEEKRMLEAILGPDIGLDHPGFALLRRQLPDFPTEKVLALHRLQQAFAEKTQELYSAGGAFRIETRDALQKEQRTEIARLLTPQELEEFDLRTGNVANNLRNRLAGVDVTEQEFRTLHRLQLAFDDQYGRVSSLIDIPPDQRSAIMRQRSETQRQLDGQIKATLGEQRYADYQRTNDGNYQQTSRLVARLGLPPETTTQVYAVQQELQQRANTVQSNRTLTPDDRNAQLAPLAAEAQSRVTALLGASGWEAYSLNGGGWLRQLQPSPVPTAAGRGGSGGTGGGRSGRGGGG